MPPHKRIRKHFPAPRRLWNALAVAQSVSGTPLRFFPGKVKPCLPAAVIIPFSC